MSVGDVRALCAQPCHEGKRVSGHRASPPLAAAAAAVCALRGQHPGGAVAECEPLGGGGTAARAGDQGGGPSVSMTTGPDPPVGCSHQAFRMETEAPC